MERQRPSNTIALHINAAPYVNTNDNDTPPCLFFFAGTAGPKTHAAMANSTLWLASQAGRCLEVEALLPGKFDQATLQTALRVALANDHAGVVYILIRAGLYRGIFLSDVHICVALRHDSADALRSLVEAKASMNTLPFCRRYAVIAARHGAMKCLQVMVMAKADLSLHEARGKTPVGEAAAQGLVGIVHFLVQAKADINADYWGETPVHAAAAGGHVHAVHLLLLAKADTTRCSDDVNESPLFLAAVGGHAAVVRRLLAHMPALAAVATRRVSSHIGLQIAAGSTPLDVARQFRHDDVVSLLVAATAIN